MLLTDVCGTYCGSITAHCKNKLCEKSSQIGTYNGKTPDNLGPCPFCGFNTLSQFHLTTKMIEDMNIEIEKIGQSFQVPKRLL